MTFPENEEELYQLLKRQRQPINENLLTAEELGLIKEAIVKVLDKSLPEGSLALLRFRKLKAEMRGNVVWSNERGYPVNGEDFIMPWIRFFEDYLGERTIKRRLEDSRLWVESRVQGEDEHILIGEKSGSTSKVHLIVDGGTGEIRVDPKDQSPHDLLARIETVLTTRSGQRIRSTRSALEFLDEESSARVGTSSQTPKNIAGVQLNGFHETGHAVLRKIEMPPGVHYYEAQRLLAEWIHDVHQWLKREAPAWASRFMGDFQAIEDDWRGRRENHQLRAIDEVIRSDDRHREAEIKRLSEIGREKLSRLEEIMRANESSP